MATSKTEARAELVREEASKDLARADREVGVNAAVARARAEVEAPYTIARSFPRSWLDVRTRLVGELDRLEYSRACVFARQQGNKEDPPGSGRWVPNIVEGLSIRFAESAMSIAGNIMCGKRIEFDDEEKRIYRVLAVDLETNAIAEDTIVIEKTVERSEKGAEYRTELRRRRNTKGETTIICAATEDEITLKANNAASKARRNLILSLMPPDLKDECLSKARAVRDKGIQADPHAEEKAIADGFADLGVLPSALADYLGHPIEQCSPAELGLLRGFYEVIKQGEASWADLVGEKGKPEAEAPKTARGKGLAAELAKKRLEREAAAAEEAKKKEPPKTEGAKPTPNQGRR